MNEERADTEAETCVNAISQNTELEQALLSRGAPRRSSRLRHRRRGLWSISRVLLISALVIAVTGVLEARPVSVGGSSPQSSAPGIQLSFSIPGGAPLDSVSVQGLIAAPPDSGSRGFETVFTGSAPGGTFQLNSAQMANLDRVSSEWTAYLGSSVERESSPDLMVVVFELESTGLFVKQVSVPLTTWDVEDGFSGKVSVPVAFAASPTVTAAQLAAQPGVGVAASTGLMTDSLPNPGEPCGTATACYEATGYIVTYPTSGNAEIPISLIQTIGSAWGILTYTLVSSESTLFNMGTVTGTGQTMSDPLFSTGGTDWKNTVEFGTDFAAGYSGGSTEGYIYLDGAAEAEQWQLYDCVVFNTHLGVCTGGDKATNTYIWEAGILPEAPVNGVLQGGSASGFPALWTDLSQEYSLNEYGIYTGEGDVSSPTYTVYSNQFVDAYAQSDTGWESEALSVGLDILTDITGASGLDVALALGFGGAMTSTSSVSFVKFDATSGYNIVLEDWVGSTSISYPGGTGYLPLMAVVISAEKTGGGGCVAYGSPILTPYGYIPVQDLRPGSHVEEYDSATGSLYTGELVSANPTPVNEVVDVNHGWLMLTPTEQPVYIQNSTFVGWLHDPQNLTPSDMIWDPVSMSWVPVTSVQLIPDRTTVFDVVTTNANNFVDNGALLDVKAP